MRLKRIFIGRWLLGLGSKVGVPVQPRRKKNPDQLSPNQKKILYYKSEELPAVDSPLLITVVDLSGRLIYQKELGGINGTDRLNAVEIWDTHLIGEGVYLITITDALDGDSYGTQRVVIQH